MTTYRLPIEIEHAWANWFLVDYRKYSPDHLTAVVKILYLLDRARERVAKANWKGIEKVDTEELGEG